MASNGDRIRMGDMSIDEAPSSALRYVACISYPRSGHHLIVRVLESYFKEAFRYCNYTYFKHHYEQPCEHCCLTFPCIDPRVSMTKNHDMELNGRWNKGIPKVVGVPHLVLIRNFLEAVVSDYNLYVRENPDSLATWYYFSKIKSGHYRRFARKWITGNDRLEKLTVCYEDLTSNPLSLFSEIITFFHPHEPLDLRRLQNSIDTAVMEDITPTGINRILDYGVRSKRNVEDFKYYDPEYFAKLEAVVSDTLMQLGYPLRFSSGSSISNSIKRFFWFSRC